MAPMPRLAQLWEHAEVAVRRHGIRGSASRAARLARGRLYAHSRHVWYELDLRAPRPRRDLPEGFRLKPAEDVHLVEIAALREATSVPAMRRLRAMGHEPWVVDGNGRVAFVCWIFRGCAPVAGANGGWIDLPDEIGCLEDSLTAPGLRGRGIATGAWCALADRLTNEGLRTLVTKVEVWNQSSRSAVAKAGFREVAEMTLVRAWGRTRVAVSPTGGGTGPLLADLIVG